MATDTSAATVVLVTRDRVLGEALVEACRPHGLAVELVERSPRPDEAEAQVIDLDDVDPSLTVQRFAAAVIDGASVRHPGVSSPPAQGSVLTERERQVCGELARGCGRAEVARALGISENTVRTHLQNIFAKLGVRDRAELVAWVFATGMVEPGGEG